MAQIVSEDNNVRVDFGVEDATPILQQVASKSVFVDSNQLYTYGGEEMGYISRYPDYSPLRDNEDYFAKQQTFLDKVSSGAGQFWTLAKNTFANHFQTYGRDFDAIANMDMDALWKDSFGTESAHIVKASQDLHPIYETAEQRARRDKDGGFFNSLGQYVPFTGRSTNAWMSLVGQLGFTAGVIGAVSLESLGLAGATALTEGGAAPIVGGKIGLNLKKVKDMKSFWNLVRQSRKVLQLDKAKKTGNLLNRTLKSNYLQRPLGAYRMFVAASGEGAIEANMSALEFWEKEVQKYIDENGKYPPVEELLEIEKESIKVGNSVFGWNIPVLMASNLLTIGNVFKPKTFSRSPIVRNAASKKIASEAAELSSKSFIKSAFKNYPNLQKSLLFGQKAGSKLAIPFGEGMEEFLQGVGSRAAQDTYSVYDSKASKGLSGFIAASMKEASHSFGTREGWDEFIAGFLTGGGIKITGNLYNKLSGKNAKEKAFINQAVEDIKGANSRYLNVLHQFRASENSQEAINENKIKDAKDSEIDAEISLFNTLSEYGVVEDYLDELADNINEWGEAHESELKDMLQDRTVEEVVNSVKGRFKVYDDVYKKASKRLGNPYNEGSSEFVAWDRAIRMASTFEVYAKNSFERVEQLQAELQKDYPIDATVLSAALDPTTLPEEINKLADHIKKREETLSELELSKEERQNRQKEISRDKEQLKSLESIQNVYFDKEGNFKEGKDSKDFAITVANKILKGMYNDVNSAPADLKQQLEDMLELENEANEYRTLYNYLSNRELFDAFGVKFVNRYMESLNTTKDNIEQAMDNPITEPTEEGLTQEDFDTALEGTEEQGASGEARKQATEIQTKIDNGDIVRKSDGSLEYNGKKYTNNNELLDQLLKDQQANDVINTVANPAGESVRSIINKRFNDMASQLKIDEQEVIEDNEATPQPVRANISKEAPKTKAKSEEEKFAFVARQGKTILHYFDKVLAKIWRRDESPLAKLTAKLKLIGDTKTKNALEKAFRELGMDIDLTTLYLADEITVFGEKDKEALKTSSSIRIISDGVRHYILTNNNEGTAGEVIERELGLQIEAEGQNIVVKRNGEHITSPFRASEGFTEANDAAIHKAKRGDKLTLEITDNEYNKNLLKSQNKDRITDRLHISVKDKDNVVVGILRAADFLFEVESNTSVKEFRERLRNKLNAGEIIPGAIVGETEVKAPVTSRNKNFVNGGLEFTKIGEFSPENFEKQFFYITEDGYMIDDEGRAVEDTDAIHDRRNFRIGAIYMKILDKKTGINHTVQIYRYDREDSTWTPNEFIEEKFLTEGVTDLNTNNPILSKRLVVDMNFSDEFSDVNNRKETLKQQYENVVSDGNTKSLKITDHNGKVHVLASATLKGNILVTEEREYHLNDIRSISQVEENFMQEDVNSDTQHVELWVNVREGTEEEINKWLANSAVPGVQYELPDGFIISIKHSGFDKVYFSIEKNGYVSYTAIDREGKRKDVKINEGETQVDEESVMDEFSAEFGIPTSVTPIPFQGTESVEDREERTLEDRIKKQKSKLEADIIRKIQEQLSIFKIDAEEVFLKMQQAYQESVKQGEPIQSLQELTEKGGLTSEQQDMFNIVVTPVFYDVFWKHITQSEAVWQTISDAAWNKFKTDISLTTGALESLNPTNTPPERYEQSTDKLGKRVIAALKKVDLGIKNLPKISLMNQEQIKKVTSALREFAATPLAEFKQGVKTLVDKFSKLGLHLELQGLVTINKVSKKTLNRNPVKSFDYGDIYTDLTMTNYNGKVYVRNEEDGYFVEVEPTKQKVPNNTWKIQKGLEKLLGLKFSLGYLDAYLKINGNFKGLKQRALAESNRRKNPAPNQGGFDVITNEEVTSEDRFKNYYKVITTVSNQDAVVLNNDTYYNIMSLEDGGSLFIKEGAVLTAQQFRNILKDLNLQRKAVKRTSSLSNRYKAMKSIQTKIEQLDKCN